MSESGDVVIRLTAPAPDTSRSKSPIFGIMEEGSEATESPPMSRSNSARNLRRVIVDELTAMTTIQERAAHLDVDPEDAVAVAIDALCERVLQLSASLRERDDQVARLHFARQMEENERQGLNDELAGLRTKLAESRGEDAEAAAPAAKVAKRERKRRGSLGNWFSRRGSGREDEAGPSEQSPQAFVEAIDNIWDVTQTDGDVNSPMTGRKSSLRTTKVAASLPGVAEMGRNDSEVNVAKLRKRSLTPHSYDDIVSLPADVPTDNSAAAVAARAARIPYWLLSWWLDINTTDRPSVNKHPLLELLLHPTYSFSNALVNVMRTQAATAERSAKHLMLILGSYDCALPVLETAISTEVSTALSETTLFRSNSITPKMLTQFAKLVGSSYVRYTLGSTLVVCCEEALSEDGLEPIDAASRLLTVIIQSADNCPPLLRHVCIVLDKYVTERFPDHRYAALGGFVFLRLFCPAIVTPSSYGITDDKVAQCQPFLIQVSKMLQSMSNGIAAFRKKHNPDPEVCAFFEEATPALHAFFDELASDIEMPEEPRSPEIVWANLANVGVSLVEEALTGLQNFVTENLQAISKELETAVVTEEVPRDYLHSINVSADSLLSTEANTEDASAWAVWCDHEAHMAEVLFENDMTIAIKLLEVNATMDADLLVHRMLLFARLHSDIILLTLALLESEAQGVTDFERLYTTPLGHAVVFDFFKVTCSDFLAEAILPTIQKIIKKKDSIEIDASRMEGVRESTLRSNQNKLAGYVTEVLKAITSTIDDMPPEARAVCAFLAKSIAPQFPGIDHLGAHIFITRFVAPVLQTPNMLDLIEELPEFDIRRTFVLISISIKNVVLGSRFTDGEQAYLGFMDAALDRIQDKIDVFVQQVETSPLYSDVESPVPTIDQRIDAAVTLAEALSARAEDVVEHAGDALPEKQSASYNMFDRATAVVADGRRRDKTRRHKMSVSNAGGSP